MKKTFSIGGVHPNDSKIAAGSKIETLPLPKTVFISMNQHLGAPAKPTVAPGDRVKTGQIIGEPGGFISAYVHSSVTGTVKSVGPYKALKTGSSLWTESRTTGWSASAVRLSLPM